MPRKKLSEFGKLRRRLFLAQADAARLFEVSLRTVQRWEYRDPRPVILARLRERERHLSGLHPDWTGFKIDLRGNLRGPNGLIASPETLRRMLFCYRCHCPPTS